MRNIFQLAYISRASDEISYSDIHNILESARVFNAQNDITGCLIFRDGYFLQVLEGAEDKILSLVEKIKRDDRNHRLNVVLAAVAAERLFDSWSMAFVDGDLGKNSTQELLDLFDMCRVGGMRDHDLMKLMVRKFRESTPDLK